jgi:hypothetical protein
MKSQTRARVALALGIVFLCGGTVWAVRSLRSKPPGPDPAVKAIQDEGAALRSNKDLTPEQRADAIKKLWEKEKNLTDAQKQQLGDLRFEGMFNREAERAARYFNLPDDQREEQLKKDRDEERKMRDAFRETFKAMGGGGPRGTNPDGQGPPGGDRRGPPGGGDPDQFEKRMSDRLLKSTPEQRAQIAAYRAIRNQQRQNSKK